MKVLKIVFCLSLLVLASLHGYCQHVPKNELSRYPALLVGKWQSLDDPKSFLIITKTSYQEVYEKEKLTTLTYQVTNYCPDPSAPNRKRKEKDILVTYDKARNTSYCYGIESLATKKMVLTYLGRGNTLSFRKVK